MASTTVDYTAQLDELNAALERARKAKKGTKAIKDQIAEVQRQAEAATAEAVTEAPKRRGRPRTKSPEFYALRDQFKRTGRGRPSRAQVVADLEKLGMTFEVPVEDLTMRELETAFKDELARQLAEVA